MISKENTYSHWTTPVGDQILNMFNIDNYGESADDYIMPVPTHQ